MEKMLKEFSKNVRGRGCLMNQKANFARIFCLSHSRAFENFLIKRLASTEMLEMQSNSNKNVIGPIS